MNVKKLGIVLTATMGLSGCMTAGMLKDAGHEYDKGNYISGTFMGGFSLVFGPIIDIFTLGGLLDSPQKVDQFAQVAVPVAATAAAAHNSSSYNSGTSYSSNSSASNLAAATAMYAQSQPNNGTSSYSPSTPVSSTPTVAVTPPTAHEPVDPFTYSAGVNNCLVFEKKTTGGLGVADGQWRNTCSFGITVSFCEINANNNECSRHIVGAESLKAGQANYILNHTKHINYIACKDPYYLPDTKIQWSGDNMSGNCQALKTDIAKK